MNLNEFCQALADHPDHNLRFVPTGYPIADHFHVTEVGRVEKQFVDCGGKPRSTVACVLQTLVANDKDHRLSTTKLTRIMQLTESLGMDGETQVEVEHQERSVSVDSIDRFEVIDGVLQFYLEPKHTACLAEDACGIGGASLGLNVIEDCCDRPGSC